MKQILVVIFFCYSIITFGQFAPQVGKVGTTAIYKDSSIIINWASGCTFNRGWQNIADTSIGKASVGDELNVIGKVGNGIASLGDGGEAILTFNKPIKNGNGFDFVVFENGFIFNDSLYYLELAFVEVSSNGKDFFRFKASSLTDTSYQADWYHGTEATKINNLAGKYLINYGTPFDLEELDSISGLDINRITHVKIIDVVGSVNPSFSQRDFYGNIINDPWPTAFASSGFDLDGVGVINQNNEVGITENFQEFNFSLYPNPAGVGDILSFTFNLDKTNDFKVCNALGSNINYKILSDNKIKIETNIPGVYHLSFNVNGKAVNKKIVLF